MIPHFNEVREEEIDRREEYEKKLLREFDEFMKDSFPAQGTSYIHCDAKYLSVSSLITKKYAKYGWDVQFECKFCCGEVYNCRVIIKGIE